MNIQEIETFRGLIKSSDINKIGFLKKSSLSKIFEDASHFTRVILKNLIIDNEEYIQTKCFELPISEYETVYVRTALTIESLYKIKVVHKLLLLNENHSKDDETLSKQSLILISKNIDKTLKIDQSISNGIYSAFRDLVRKEE
jgi:hypothetical protein